MNKIIIKELKDGKIKYKLKGKDNELSALLAELLCMLAIKNKMNKTEFIKHCGNSYNIVKKELNND